jgi:hypothetical protein|tara:strand:+ start:3767 stop:3946 length:180 start_codon:yes stop_codon:yes gene_type:complete
MFNYLKNKVTGLFKERTTWDGMMLIAAGVVFLMFTPLAKIAAWVAIVWGAWTIWKREED